MNTHNWLKKAKNALYNSDTPELDAQIILSFVTGKSRSWLFAFNELMITDTQLISLEKILMRRVKGEPLAYLLGECEFWSLTLKVTNDTIIPRPDTEIIVIESLNHLSNSSLKVLDLGTGTGAIALAIASELPKCKVFGVDFIDSVVKTAQYNAEKLKIINATFFLSDWFHNVPPNKFDLIVSNPPYIEADSLYLKSGDICFEPRTALVSDENGLSNLKIIIKNSLDWLKKKCWLLVEHGWQQDKSVRYIMKKYGYLNINTIKDYGGNPRVTLGMSPK
ncbi:peptide chain release factor N(5)-glutamine methyltransferase [Candidatus Pantoea edessiphila]|uniref:Release factor glutamine methyltransferase n=1 Tax=Candidatus Pantoea edessiphila TaxID=2044610 RepID=A0A2P5SYS2_9GAMM|nr:peptide chain release factor N(5)-glutamine methyltransferase [Candidatus Pantoea edessiphila]MBK4775371.1 peptide chain release factor N(5)-glutamine methyltransferase [Pantoea sp. Edef]PPI87497.1 peptide chain release factor N(5)-glutamine methyltransferase [Candidatus Pantoea edessiphila]